MPIRHASPKVARREPIGLILTGGGARAAYQVGVLGGILDILDPDRSSDFANPFGIICGSSAGAINAAALACRADEPHRAVDGLERLWGNLHTGEVYHADAARLLRTGLRWFAMLAVGWMLPELRDRQPRSLLDNQPLGELLSSTLDFKRLQQNLSAGQLQALAITATAYTT